jgi:hypothetical protein
MKDKIAKRRNLRLYRGVVRRKAKKRQTERQADKKEDRQTTGHGDK